MGKNWLIDITDSRGGELVVRWIKDGTRGEVRGSPVPFRPPILVDGPQPLKERFLREVRTWSDVARVDRVTMVPSLFDHRRRSLVSVTADRNQARRKVASRIDAFGDYREFTLYDVDLSAPQLYHLTHDLYPFAPVVDDHGTLRAQEPAEAIDYELPPLVTAELRIELEK